MSPQPGPHAVGGSSAYPPGNRDMVVRSTALVTTLLHKRHRRSGYLWVPSRVRTSTEECDPPAYAHSTATRWTRITMWVEPTALDRLAVPLVKTVRWYVSLAAARIVNTRAVVRAANTGNRPADLLIRAALAVRGNPNIHPDGEITRRLGHPPFDWYKAPKEGK